MSAGLWGADIDAMAGLQRSFGAAADRLALMTNAAAVALAGIDQIWHGPDTAAYRAQWQQIHRPRLTEAAAALRQAADTIGANATQQEQASAADLGGRIAVAAVLVGPFGPPGPGTPGTPGSPGTPGPAGPTDGRQPLDDILTNYQTAEDEMIEWHPPLGPFPIRIPFTSGTTMTRTEGELLDDLASARGLDGLNRFKSIASNSPDDLGRAFTTADTYYPRFAADGTPIVGAEDGHNDAFRHTYLNALLTREFGEDFARDWATAHEGVPGNPADKEAMDLHNNEVGRTIALAHPDASDQELADLVAAAVTNGDVVVIDGRGDLRYSEQVAVGATGSADDPPAPGRIVPGDGPGST